VLGSLVVSSTPPDRSPPGPEGKEHLRELGRVGGLGFTFAASMFVFGWGGYWLDGKLGTSPLLLIVGGALGAIGGFIHIVKSVP
jgi:F0F1-type ATP synthase assembly protein I